MDTRSRNNVTVTGRADGPVLLLTHGFGCDQNMWRLVVPALARNHRVVLFDYVASGQSDPQHGTSSATAPCRATLGTCWRSARRWTIEQGEARPLAATGAARGVPRIGSGPVWHGLGQFRSLKGHLPRGTMSDHDHPAQQPADRTLAGPRLRRARPGRRPRRRARRGPAPRGHRPRQPCGDHGRRQRARVPRRLRPEHPLARPARGPHPRPHPSPESTQPPTPGPPAPHRRPHPLHPRPAAGRLTRRTAA